MKFMFNLFILLFVFVLNTNLSLALELNNIGNLNLEGKKYTEWWYTGVDPSFIGKAEPNSNVKVTLGTNSYDVKANESGDWSVNTVSPAGTYDVNVTGDNTSYTFKLNLGQSMPANMGNDINITKSDPNTINVPTTGFSQISSLMFSLGLILLAIYFYFWGTTNCSNTKLDKYYLKQ